MRNWIWIVIGAAVGVACGSVFGDAYVPAGAFIGAAGGIALFWAMRRPGP